VTEVVSSQPKASVTFKIYVVVVLGSTIVDAVVGVFTVATGVQLYLLPAPIGDAVKVDLSSK
jgi:heme A synthase